MKPPSEEEFKNVAKSRFNHQEEQSMNKGLGLILIIVCVFSGYYLVRDINQQKELTEEEKPLANVKEHWHHYASPKGDFHVMFPNMPHHANEMKTESQNQEKKEYEVFVSSKEDGTLFSIYLITFPDKKTLEKDKDFLVGIIKDMLSSNPKNVIKDLKTAPYRGIDTVDFKVLNDDTAIDGKAFVKNNTVYVLSATAKNSNRNQEEIDYFIGSFVLRNGAASEQKK